MGNFLFHVIVAFLRLNSKNKEVNTLTNVITPPRLLYYINTLFSFAYLSCKGKTIY